MSFSVETYALLKNKINSIVEELGKVGFRGPYDTIESLPTPGVEGYIYLVEKEDEEDYYDEYYWNNDLEEYQAMGSTKMPDLLWFGTSEEWSLLPRSQKEKYINGLVCIYDDVAYSRTIVDVIENGNLNAVTSNAVFDGLAGKANSSDIESKVDKTGDDISGDLNIIDGNAIWIYDSNNTKHAIYKCDRIEGSNYTIHGDNSVNIDTEGTLTLNGAKNVEISIDNPNNTSKMDILTYGADFNISTVGSDRDAGNINITAGPAEQGYDGGEINISTNRPITIETTGTGELNLNSESGLYADVAGDIDVTTDGTMTIYKKYDPSTSSKTGGNLTVEGIISSNGSDYAERFETLEDCPVGRFVTLDGEKIRLAQPEDSYILGVTSENPAIIGNKDNDGVPVGLVGKLWVESDGTCKVNGFAVSGTDGIATDGDSTRYRVMAVEGNRVKVLVR